MISGVAVSAPGDAMCTIQGWFGGDDPSCSHANGKGAFMSLIPSTQRTNNTPGYALHANHWTTPLGDDE